jgi:hypothetical protein
MKILQKILVLFGAILICFIILENLLNIFLPQFNPAGKFEFYRNKQGIQLGIKNFSGRYWDNAGDFNVTVSINKYGFRDRKDFKMSTANDIFVVGDSFSFGYGVEEDKRYSNLLESSLRENIFNISMPGDFDDYSKFIKYAQEHGATIKKLIVGVCMENDLNDYLKRGAENYKIIDDKILKKIRYYLESKTTTFNVCAYLINSNITVQRFFRKVNFIKNPIEIIPQVIDNPDVLLDSARRLAKIVNDYDALILIVPSRALWAGDNQKNQIAIHQSFVSLLRKEGLNVVDVRQSFEAGGNPMEYYFPHDGHWNEKGHRKAAEVIVKHLRKNRHTLGQDN